MNNFRVIGEGTYGCVHKPSLPCKSSSNIIDYKNKTSKIMNLSNASSEMREYNMVENADKEQKYYLGKPIQCSPLLNTETISAIKTCTSGRVFLDEPDDLSLLIMEDGGLNIIDFMQNIVGLPPNEIANKMELFWLSTHNLLKGLQMFINNGLVHHDLKPQNILFNTKTNQLKFIDFGLMTRKHDIIKDATKSDYKWNMLHWSFPFELSFINKKRFQKFYSTDLNDRKQKYKKLIKNIKKNTRDGMMIQVFLNVSSINDNPDLKKEFLTDLYSLYKYDYKNTTQESAYDMFINRSVDTIDEYGTGIALLYAYSKTIQYMNLGNNILTISLKRLFYLMITPDINKRLTVDEVLNRYEEILTTSGLLSKHKLQIIDHEIVSDQIIPIPNNIQTQIETVVETPVKIPDKIIQEIINTDLNNCPQGKEMNPHTKRCVKMCKPKQIRDAKFKCKNVNLKKTTNQILPITKGIAMENIEINNAPIKICPHGKEINPHTKRCVNICKPNQTRNADFKCKSARTRKTKPIKIEPPSSIEQPKLAKSPARTKTCPPNKELNPHTKRCVNMCKPNQTRNADFKCKGARTRKTKPKKIESPITSLNYSLSP